MYKVALVLFLFIEILLDTCKAQQNTFSVSYTDSLKPLFARSIIQDFEGNFIFCGRGSNALTKIDSLGNVLWCKRYQWSANDYLEKVSLSKDSSLVLIGTKNIPNHSSFLIIKATLNGDTIWTKAISFGNTAYPYSVQQTFDNGYIIGGGVKEGPLGINYAITKLDSNGNLEWSRIYRNYSGTIQSITQDSDSSYICVVGTNDTWANELGGLIKISKNGMLLMAKRHAFVNIPVTGFIGVDTNNTGYLWFGTGDRVLVIIQTDFNGNIIWRKNYTYTTYLRRSSCFTKTKTGNYLMAFWTTSRGLLVQADSLGNIHWAKDLTIDPYSILESHDNNIVIAGLLNDRAEIFITDTLISNSCSNGNVNFISSLDSMVSFTVPLDTFVAGLELSGRMHLLNSNLTRDTGCTLNYTDIGEENILADLSIFPNPANGNFVINFPNLLFVEMISVYNMYGIMVYLKKPEDVTSIIEINRNLKPGIYTIVINTNKKLLSKKIILY